MPTGSEDGLTIQKHFTLEFRLVCFSCWTIGRLRWVEKQSSNDLTHIFALRPYGGRHYVSVSSCFYLWQFVLSATKLFRLVCLSILMESCNTTALVTFSSPELSIEDTAEIIVNKSGISCTNSEPVHEGQIPKTIQQLFGSLVFGRQFYSYPLPCAPTDLRFMFEIEYNLERTTWRTILQTPYTSDDSQQNPCSTRNLTEVSQNCLWDILDSASWGSPNIQLIEIHAYKITSSMEDESIAHAICFAYGTWEWLAWRFPGTVFGSQLRILQIAGLSSTLLRLSVIF